jgi:phosphohistidine phosphatase
MRRLILMRHAKAEKGSPSGGDHDRPLAERGLSDAARVGRALAAKGLRPDLALVSDSARTRETWDAVVDAHAGAWGDVELRIERGLYNASSDEIADAVAAVAEQAETVLVIAHNPGVHDAAVDYLGRCAPSPAVRDRLAARFPTGAAALFRFDGSGCGFDGLLTPRELGGGGDD